MFRSGLACGALLMVVLTGCSTAGGGFSLFPSGGSYLTTQAREVVDTSPRAANLPRELARSVLPAHFLQPGDIVVIEPVRLDTDVRLPADQRVMADGTVDLGGFGRVIVAGLTIEDAERLIEARIVDAGGEPTQINLRLIEPQQVYYVLGEVNAPGSFPLIGSETVLDAIIAAGGMTGRASPCDIILVRPTPPPSCRVTLPICYQAITQLGDTTTNYQVQPGDRIFVATRTLHEDIFFWRNRHGCERCNGLQCPCPDPSVAGYGYHNPISEFLPPGPPPVEFQEVADPDAVGADVEMLPQPSRRAPLPADPAEVRPVPRTVPRDPAPAEPVDPVRPVDPTRPDPFDADDFFDRPQ